MKCAVNHGSGKEHLKRDHLDQSQVKAVPLLMLSLSPPLTSGEAWCVLQPISGGQGKRREREAAYGHPKPGRPLRASQPSETHTS